MEIEKVINDVINMLEKLDTSQLEPKHPFISGHYILIIKYKKRTYELMLVIDSIFKFTKKYVKEILKKIFKAYERIPLAREPTIEEEDLDPFAETWFYVLIVDYTTKVKVSNALIKVIPFGSVAYKKDVIKAWFRFKNETIIYYEPTDEVYTSRSKKLMEKVDKKIEEMLTKYLKSGLTNLNRETAVALVLDIIDVDENGEPILGLDLDK